MAENWTCAKPLVEKNYDRPIDSKLLARRIADECALPFVPTNYSAMETPAQVEAFHSIERADYEAGLLVFTLQIEARITSLRLHKDIPLRR